MRRGTKGRGTTLLSRIAPFVLPIGKPIVNAKALVPSFPLSSILELVYMGKKPRRASAEQLFHTKSAFV